MKALPISETTKGVVYKINESAFFYTLDSAYYNNVLYKEDLRVMTFTEFKKIYFR